jgi:hypothetical protein
MIPKLIIQAYCNNCIEETQRVELPLDVLLSCRAVGGPSKFRYENDGTGLIEIYEPDAGIELPFSVAECGCGRNPCQTLRVSIDPGGLEVSDG